MLAAGVTAFPALCFLPLRLGLRLFPCRFLVSKVESPIVYSCTSGV